MSRLTNHSLVRMVGGCAAGEEVWHDVDRDGPVIRRAVYPDFPRYVTADMKPEATFEQEIYHIHKIVFDEYGHRHYYAAPAKRELMDVLNELWDGYKADADQERRNEH